MSIVILGIGTNLGNRVANLEGAVTRIKEYIGLVIKSSSVYEAEPWGFESNNEFLNMVIKVETKLSPLQVLREIQKIELLLGRIRSEKQYFSRVIDIDILLYEDMVIDEERLKIPHPLMHERRFVLVPLCEIASVMEHPKLKMSFASLLKLCEDKSSIKLYMHQDKQTSGHQDNTS